jgi:hypothetical protein
MDPKLARFFKDKHNNIYDFSLLKYICKENKNDCDIHWCNLDKNDDHIEIFFVFIHNQLQNKSKYELVYVYEYFDGYFNFKSFVCPMKHILNPFIVNSNINMNIKLIYPIMWNGYTVETDGNKIALYKDDKLYIDYYGECFFDDKNVEGWITYEGDLVIYSPASKKTNEACVLIEQKFVPRKKEYNETKLKNNETD